ncbi:MAG TPA: hypothetical protein VM848_05345 [Acidimicrobiia bacterium]|nr:hypothetical protein [Acidimicrobiia bacterium]
MDSHREQVADLTPVDGAAALGPFDRRNARYGLPLLVAIVVLLLVGAWLVRNLSATDWNPTMLVAVAAEEGPSLGYSRALLGDSVENRPGRGHDGRFFFVQANDPWLLEPHRHAAVLDRPVYRSQRMLYPTLASGFGLLEPWGAVWGLLAVSVVTISAGTYATALVARGMGASAWWGLAFGFNIGVVSELLVGGGGHLGFALVMFSIAAIQRGRLGWSVAALSGAVLAREVMLVATAGIVVWLWRQVGPKAALIHAVVPGAVVAAWAMYVRSRIGWMSGLAEVEEIGWPFVGFVQALEFWPNRPLSFAVGVAVLALLAVFTLRFIRSPGSLVGYAAIGFVPLAVLLTLQVWFNYFDITRAVSPVITAFLLMAFAAPNRDHEAPMEGTPSP